MRKTILVTGGLGYIGSHTVVELQKEGFKVIIIDDLSNSEEFVLDRIEQITNEKPEFHKFDLKDNAKTKSFFEYKDIDGIIHFAASKAVGESTEKPLMYYQNNVTGLLNLLEAAKENGVDNFIFSSSCTVYGQADELPIDESAPFKTAESPYGQTKQMGEYILQDYAKAYDKKVLALRYFNPIGAHKSTLIGELPKGVPNNLIPFVTQTAMGIRACLSVFGDDYPTRDGTAIRDYIYVVDLAQAHVKGLQRLLADENKVNYEIYNLGTGTGSTVLEVVDAFEKANNLKLNYKIVGRRPGDITAAYADNAKAEKELGWIPKTSLEDALKTAWEWQVALKGSEETD